ncbi:helix-turn-helix transcriptional regulator [Gluconobacter japonicus]|uniref:helix-turn-helix transcriptional regulator n=1 Tax=Gluconobacter japonicus TaxID=376620 RepID=UPI0038D057D0
MRLGEVAVMVKLSPSYIAKLVREQRFPPSSHRFGPRAVRWLKSDIVVWLQACD